MCSARLSPSPSPRRSLQAHIAPQIVREIEHESFPYNMLKRTLVTVKHPFWLGVPWLELYPLHPTVMPTPNLLLFMRGMAMKTIIRAPPIPPRKTKQLQYTPKRSISLKRSACAGLNRTRQLVTQGKKIAGRHSIEIEHSSSSSSP